MTTSASSTPSSTPPTTPSTTPAPLRIGVMGAGAIGCYVGGRLALTSAPRAANASCAVHDVVLVGRAAIAAEITAHGLHLTSYQGFDARVTAAGAASPAAPAGLRVVTDVSALADRDIVIVTVKGGDTRSAGASLAHVLPPGCVVVSLQNGVRNAAILRDVLPNHAVLAAMVPFNVLRAGAGRFHQGTSGRIAIERAHDDGQDGARARGEALAAALRGAGLGARMVPDIVGIQWGKLLVNLNNAVNALAGVPIQQMIKDRGYRLVMAAVLDEAVRALAAAKVRTILEPPVPAGLVARILRMPDAVFALVAPRIIKVDAEARSSMWDDLSRGRKTEIDALNGEIVAAARTAGQVAPVNEAIVRLVKDAEGQPPQPLSSAELRARVNV